MDEFLEACGASGPLRLAVEEAHPSASGAGAGARVLEQPFAVIGRDPRCDVVLDHPEVSPRHVYLQIVNGRLLYIDLGSRSGVSHAGKRRKVGWLARDEALRIGPYRVRLHGGDSARGDAPSLPAADAAMAFEDGRVLDAMALELSHRAVRSSRCEARSGLALIGSGADCPVRLVDPSVATYHAALLRAPAGAWVVDLLGEGGIRRDGQAVRAAKLVEGDAIQLGHSVMRVAGTAPAPAPVAITPAIEPPPPAPLVQDDAFVFGSRREVSANVEPPAPSSMIPMEQVMELVEGVIAPMVSQGGLMREQMVGEFHQARAALYETFTTLHQEQSAVFHHELDQLRLLAQDLTRLRADLDRQLQRLAQRDAAPIAPDGATSSMRITAERELRADGPAPFKKAPVSPAASTLDAIARDVSETVPRDHDENVHNQLCDRIVQIRETQQSPWRKLMSLLPGAANGRSVP
jgi:pSer/pThr/pTyr-binding forkhead associated (FHA) protein